MAFDEVISNPFEAVEAILKLPDVFVA